MREHRRRLVLSTLALWLVATSAARAQKPGVEAPGPETEPVVDPGAVGRARAHALFTEGVASIRRRDFETAAARFRAALELHQAASIRHNLAAALMELD